MSKSGRDPYDEFAKDETYPCPKCMSVRNPRKCLRSCFRHRLWVAVDWINMQYNAGIISKAERDERIYSAKQKYSQEDDENE